MWVDHEKYYNLEDTLGLNHTAQLQSSGYFYTIWAATYQVYQDWSASFCCFVFKIG